MQQPFTPGDAQLIGQMGEAFKSRRANLPCRMLLPDCYQVDMTTTATGKVVLLCHGSCADAASVQHIAEVLVCEGLPLASTVCQGCIRYMAGKSGEHRLRRTAAGSRPRQGRSSADRATDPTAPARSARTHSCARRSWASARSCLGARQRRGLTPACGATPGP